MEGHNLLYELLDFERIKAGVYENIFYTFWRDYGRIGLIFYTLGDNLPKYYVVGDFNCFFL